MEGARKLRNVGMAKALTHAERMSAGWSDAAYLFLRRFAREHRQFISEDVSDESKRWGLTQPPTLRAWGPIYKRAAKQGVITIDGAGRSRLRHASICPRWKSLIYREDI